MISINNPRPPIPYSKLKAIIFLRNNYLPPEKPNSPFWGIWLPVWNVKPFQSDKMEQWHWKRFVRAIYTCSKIKYSKQLVMQQSVRLYCKWFGVQKSIYCCVGHCWTTSKALGRQTYMSGQKIYQIGNWETRDWLRLASTQKGLEYCEVTFGF